MKIVVPVLIIAILLIGGCSSGRAESHSRAGYNFSTIDKVAIVAVEGAVKSEAAKNQIADLFAMEFLKKGYPVERAHVEALLKEQEFQASELTTEAGAAEAGKILNVPLNVSAVLIISIPHFGEEIAMTAKLVDIRDSSILWLGSGSGKTGRLFGLGSVWGAGADVSSEEEALFGGVAGGMLGEATDLPLSPQETEQAQRIIKRMCRTLPSRLTTK